MGLFFNKRKSLAHGITDLISMVLFPPIGYSHPTYKSVNPTYSTFKGNYGSWNENKTEWDYFCLWGHFRIYYNANHLKDNWVHIGLNGYKNGYTYTPVKTLLWDFNWHFAFNKKWPFVKIGFKNIENLFKYDE